MRVKYSTVPSTHHMRIDSRILSHLKSVALLLIVPERIKNFAHVRRKVTTQHLALETYFIKSIMSSPMMDIHMVMMIPRVQFNRLHVVKSGVKVIPEVGKFLMYLIETIR
jgi:hypothetical protein